MASFIERSWDAQTDANPDNLSDAGVPLRTIPLTQRKPSTIMAQTFSNKNLPTKDFVLKKGQEHWGINSEGARVLYQEGDTVTFTQHQYTAFKDKVFDPNDKQAVAKFGGALIGKSQADADPFADTIQGGGHTSGTIDPRTQVLPNTTAENLDAHITNGGDDDEDEDKPELNTSTVSASGGGASTVPGGGSST
jgi:hypothetical protein